jgi:hypothetical protein
MTIATSFGAGQRGLERFPPDVNRTAVGWVKRSATQHLTACTKVVGSRPAEEAGLDPTYVENALAALELARREEVMRAELRSWALLAATSLAIAGIFAFLLAMSRLPGTERIIHWPLEFFSKGLVIHVVFSLVVWFLAIFALLASLATLEMADGKAVAGGTGRLGLAFVAMSFPLLFLPAFHEDTVATLNNYVPVIIHPGYYAGLVLLLAGILLPVVRLFRAAARAIKAGHPLSPLAVAMTAGGVVYCVALVSLAFGVALVWGEAPSRTMHEHLFWGGGHVLQFLYALLMLTGWFTLANTCLGRGAIDPDIFRLAVKLIAVFSLAAVGFYLVLEPFSLLQTEAFRRLQFVLAFPSLLVALAGLAAVVQRRKAGPLPWHDPAFVALVLSPVVFGAGGIMGLLISGSDTRTPAHYHGVIAGVNLACMGLMLSVCLPRLERPVRARVRLRLQIALFGLGQLMASAGLFLAGGYGAPRKTPAGAADLVNGAVAGMYLHGVGALLAVIGGILFVATILKALLDHSQSQEGLVEGRVGEFPAEAYPA